MRIKLSATERDQIRAGAAAVGMAAAGFVARAALDAAVAGVAGVAPVGAGTALERLAGFQLELASLRRRLDLLRSEIANAAVGEPSAGPAGEALSRCAEAADQLTLLSHAIHRTLGGGF